MNKNSAKFILLLIIFFGCGLFPLAAQNIPTPSQEIDVRADAEREKRRLQNNLRKAEEFNESRERSNKKRGKVNEKDVAKVAIDKEDENSYYDFLSQPGTGLLRLYDSADCKRNKRLCPQSLAGAGSAYSLRYLIYTERNDADILFNNLAFQITGSNSLGFLTELGDIPLEKLTLTDKGIKELAEFVPSDKLEVIEKQFLVAQKGFKVGDFTYNTLISYKENSTYTFRLIHYNVARKPKSAEQGDGLGLKSESDDIIVVFRIIRKHENGSISLLWKILQKKESPTIFLE